MLTAAVNDVASHGYDTPQRIAQWMDRLRQAAQASMVPLDVLERTLVAHLRGIHARLVDKGQILRAHPGVARFTLDKVRPQLRAELDRRIVASANLIKTNRQQAMETTLRRFSGWSTSIPPGGSQVVERSDVKTDIRKSLAQLPFAERRVLIDQSHKLVASLSEIIATDGGAIAAHWRSHFRQAGYDARPEHAHFDRDGMIFAVRGNWAMGKGLMKVGPAGYTDEVEGPAVKPFCRCYWLWKYSLRDLPDEMVSAKGRSELDRVRKELAAA